MRNIAIFILSALNIFMSGCQAKPNFSIYTNGIKGQCEFDYGDFNFCENSTQNKYQKIINNTKPNFNHKYIIANIDNLGYFVAINPENNDVYPLYGNYGNPKNDNDKETGKMQTKFSINSNLICISGSKSAYRDTENSGDFCYTFNEKSFDRQFIDVSSKEVDKSKLNTKNKIDFSHYKYITLPASSEDFNLCATIQKKSPNYCLQQSNLKQPMTLKTKITDKGILEWLDSSDIKNIEHGKMYILPPEKKSQSIIFIDYIPTKDDEDYTDYTLVNINPTGNQIIHLGKKYWINKDLSFSIIKSETNIKETYRLDNTGKYTKF